MMEHQDNGILPTMLYILKALKKILPFEKEELTSTQKINEYIMTGLRTHDGIELDQLEKLSRKTNCCRHNKRCAKIYTAKFNGKKKWLTRAYKQRKIICRWNCIGSVQVNIISTCK